MEELLRLALDGVMSEERLETCIRAANLLEANNADAFADELQNVFGMQDGISDSDLFTSRVEGVLIIAVGSHLQQMGVTLEESTPFPMMVEILDSLCRLQFYIIPQSLLELLASEGTNEEILARVLHELGNLDEDDVIDHVVSVSDAALMRMQETLHEMVIAIPLPDYGEEVKLRLRLINQVAKPATFKQIYEPQPLVFDLARSGAEPETPLPSLLELVLPQLDTTRTTDRLGLELLLLVLYSNTPLTQLESVFRQTLEDFTDDYEEQRKMQAAVATKWDIIARSLSHE